MIKARYRKHKKIMNSSVLVSKIYSDSHTNIKSGKVVISLSEKEFKLFMRSREIIVQIFFIYTRGLSMEGKPSTK